MKRIEFPAVGTTYNLDKFGVYEYSVYEKHSVLAGQQRRSFLGAYDTLREAKEEHPDAEFSNA